jgi:hypothetical protein
VISETNFTVSDDRTLAGIRPVWTEAMRRLQALMPELLVDGRLRPDVYGAGNGSLARDSAGVRVISPSLTELEKAADIVRSLWPTIEERNYLAGHPRTPYYRALHIYCRVDGFEIEVQFRTRRQHVIAAWTHDRLLPPLQPPWAELAGEPQVIAFLTALASTCDARDRSVPSALPATPQVLYDVFDLDTNALA